MSEIDLTSPEVKQAIADAVAEQVDGLKRKNAELIEQNKKLRKNTEIDPAELERVEAERDQYKQAAADAQKAAKKALADAEAATKKAEQIDSQFANTLKDSALTETLTKNGVTSPALLKAAKAMLAANLQVVAEGDARAVKAGDKALADFVSEWAGSDEGKHFVTAPEGGGGGAGHSGRVNTNAKTIARSAFDGLSPGEKLKHTQAGGIVTD